MRAMILAHNLRAAGGLSVGLNVVSALSEVGRKHEYLFVLPTGVGYESLRFPPRSEAFFYQRQAGAIGQRWFEKWSLPRLARRFSPDVVWGLGNFGLPQPPCPQAFLLHMPHFLYDRQHMPHLTANERFHLWLMRKRLVESLPSTQLVFCQTHATAERFRERFRFLGRMDIMPNAVSRFATPPSGPAPAIFKELHSKTVLFCLTKYYPHKNLESLVELFQRHGQRLRDVVILLTVAADQDSRAAAFLKQLQAPALRGRIINVGPLKQQELAGYYHHSTALILPTLLESFTATYLEAMKFDCPVLTSNLDFAREVCGDAAIYFEPWNVDDMCEAVVRLRDEPAIQHQLRSQGRERLTQMFPSWKEITAEALRNLTALVHGDIIPVPVGGRRVQQTAA